MGDQVSWNAHGWRYRHNHFKEALKDGGPPLAMWVSIPWPPLVEILGACELDAVFIDLEHATFGLSEMEHLIVAAENVAVTPLVRPAKIDLAEIGRILDAGAGGIIFPLVSDAQTAERARRTLEYPPQGDRGWGGAHTRYALWDGTTAVAALQDNDGLNRGVYSEEYIRKSRSDLVSVFIIENSEGVSNVDEILDVGHPDLVTFGWADFSVEVGFDLAQCEAAARHVYEACKQRGIGVSISLGQTAGTAEPYPGCFRVVGVDTLIISAALRMAAEDARAME